MRLGKDSQHEMLCTDTKVGKSQQYAAETVRSKSRIHVTYSSRLDAHYPATCYKSEASTSHLPKLFPNHFISSKPGALKSSFKVVSPSHLSHILLVHRLTVFDTKIFESASCFRNPSEIYQNMWPLSLASFALASSLVSQVNGSNNRMTTDLQTTTTTLASGTLIASAMLPETTMYHQLISRLPHIIDNIMNSTVVANAPGETPPLVTAIKTPVLQQQTAQNDLLDPTSKWFLLCGGSDMQANTFANVCSNDQSFLVPVSGERCQQSCSCSDSGKLDCPSPAQGCSDNGAMTALCGLDTNTTFTCLCHKETDDFQLSAAVLQDDTTIPQPSSFDLADTGQDQASIFCSGSSLSQTDIAGTCMDGNFLWWSSADCNTNCKCDRFDKLTCDHPSDCGPSNTVNSYCQSNTYFHCDCVSHRQ